MCIFIHYRAEKIASHSETITKEQYEKNEKFVGHFLSEERTCAKKEKCLLGEFLFSPSKKEVKGEKKRRIEV